MRQDITNREEIVSILGLLYNVQVWSEVLVTVCKNSLSRNRHSNIGISKYVRLIYLSIISNLFPLEVVQQECIPVGCVPSTAVAV